MALKIGEMEELVKAYFADPNNKPYAIADVCLLLDIELKDLKEWRAGDNERKKKLDRVIRYTVLAGWEKGEKISGIANSLVPVLLKRYFGDEEDIRLDEDNTIKVTLFGEGGKDGV